MQTPFSTQLLRILLNFLAYLRRNLLLRRYSMLIVEVEQHLGLALIHPWYLGCKALRRQSFRSPYSLP